jgi:hypothetical protein
MFSASNQSGDKSPIISSSGSGYRSCLVYSMKSARVGVRTESVVPMAFDWSRAYRTETQTAQR